MRRMSIADSTPSNDPAAGCPFARPAFDPFEHFDLAELEHAQREAPVFFHEGLDGFFVTRYDDCARVLGDRSGHVSASAALMSHLNVQPIPEAMQIIQDSGLVLAPSVVDEDGEDHKRHRAVAQPPFSLSRIEPLDDFVRDLVAARIDAVIDRGACDVVDDVIYDVPGSVILHMMGVPDEQLGMVKGFRGPWAVFIWGTPDEETQIHTAQGMGEFGKWARGLAQAALNDDSGDDMIAETVRNLRERGIDPAQGDERLWLDSYTLNIVMAGHETTVNSLAGGMVALLEHREQWQAIIDDPTLIPNAVDEILRYITGVPAWRQRIVDDLELPSGTTLPAGALVYCAINQANRDPAVFEDPLRFDVRRENARKHLAFGLGAHTCMGNNLAKREMRIILEELVRRIPQLELVPGQDYPTSPNTTQRGPEQVQVRWTTD